jgi:hypothetical protein
VLRDPDDACIAPLDAVLADVARAGGVPRGRWVDALLDVYNAAPSGAVRDVCVESIAGVRGVRSVDVALARAACALVAAAVAADSASRDVAR